MSQTHIKGSESVANGVQIIPSSSELVASAAVREVISHDHSPQSLDPTIPDYANLTLSTEYKELKIMDQSKTEVHMLGAIGDIVKAPQAEWTGAISLKNRMESGEVTENGLLHAWNRLKDFYVVAKLGTVMRCIDERSQLDFDATTGSLETDGIGPQVPGGTLAGAVSYRETESHRVSDFQDANFKEDAKTYGIISKDKLGYLPGDHVAETLHGGIGCGAVDGLDDSHAKVNYRNISTLYNLTKSVLGDKFNEDAFARFVSSATLLRATVGYFDTLQDAIDDLKNSTHNALPVLTGSHKGVIIMINRVAGTTLNTNRLNQAMIDEAGEELQIFNYDLWFTEGTAKKLFPYSHENREIYLHSRLALAIATLMHLTDGSLQLGIHDSPDTSYDPR